MSPISQLTAEQLTRRATRGRGIRTFWKATCDRNEALDCRVYATAALAEGFGRWGEGEFTAAEQALGTIPPAASPAAPDAVEPPLPDPAVFRHGATIRSAWLHR